MGFFKQFKVRVRHGRGDEDKFNAFWKDGNYDGVMRAYKEMSEADQNEFKAKLNEVDDDYNFGDKLAESEDLVSAQMIATDYTDELKREYVQAFEAMGLNFEVEEK